MTARRLLVVLAGTGALLLSSVPGAFAEAESPATQERKALAVLDAAARAAHTRTYRGTQYVAAWRAGRSTSSIAEVRHSPAGGTTVDVLPTAGGTPESSAVPATSDLDVRLVRLLADNYELSLGPAAECTGRQAHVVEARRAGGDLAGRFWVDQDSALLLRREVLDRGGELVRSSAFASLTVLPAEPVSTEDAVVTEGALTEDELQKIRRESWQIPAQLPGALELYDARVRTHDGKNVLHLAYSDGLSSLSLFAQPGRIGNQPMDGFTARDVDDSPVWFTAASPQRVVWGGDGQVFTILSDAPTDAVTAAVTALPHDPAPRSGILDRIGRGISRVLSWLNPFD